MIFLNLGIFGECRMKSSAALLLFYFSLQTAMAQVSPLVGYALVCLHPDAKTSFEIESVPHDYLSKSGEFLGQIYKFHTHHVEGFRDWERGWEILGKETRYKEMKSRWVWSLTYLGGMGGYYEEHWLSKDTQKLTTYVGSYPPTDLTEEPSKYCQLASFNGVDEILRNLSR